ncbi:hypothetical protein D9M68_835580 [compost metagenome]
MKALLKLRPLEVQFPRAGAFTLIVRVTVELSFLAHLRGVVVVVLCAKKLERVGCRLLRNPRRLFDDKQDLFAVTLPVVVRLFVCDQGVLPVIGLGGRSSEVLCKCEFYSVGKRLHGPARTRLVAVAAHCDVRLRDLSREKSVAYALMADVQFVSFKIHVSPPEYGEDHADGVTG